MLKWSFIRQCVQEEIVHVPPYDDPFTLAGGYERHIKSTFWVLKFPDPDLLLIIPICDLPRFLLLASNPFLILALLFS
jgi:hypothetical protein